ncbi:hypothetical protein [Phocaeicola plebeius]|jgi:hypothetical protein|uniref:hypothetical protein n=1 Tax=Phocaeicola plebeius TaxID=310297 RepID=UPI00206795F1|nr:hypothetical protein [Phocaeicola plebeius]DAR08559.1 MAG TPA: hypothetical protein [Caudoviricetes sp.]
MTVKELLVVGNLSRGIEGELEKLRKPWKVGKVRTPDTLNDMNMGELMQLQSISTEKETIMVPCRVLLGMSEREVMRTDASEVIGFCFWVAREVKRINKLFASTSVPPTPEEKQAGAEALNFGPFGLLDYYALRMGITDHEAVEYVPWVRVYKCLDMDARKMRYERRLRKILEGKKK